MEDDLKLWKVEYLSNHWSDFLQILNHVTFEILGGITRKTQRKSQILNLSIGDQTKIKNALN